MRARASASIAALWSTPTARAARGASNSNIRPVPVPRSSRLRNGFAPIISTSAASTRSSGACSARGEIGRRLLAPRLARDVQADAVRVHDRIGRIETAQPFVRQSPAWFGEAEEGPRALALAGGEPRLDQQSKMARKPRLLAGGFEAREQSPKGEWRRFSFMRHKHIFISIFDLVKRDTRFTQAKPPVSVG